MYPPARWSRLSSGFICSVCDCSLVVTHSVVTPSSLEQLQYLLVLLYFTNVIYTDSQYIKHNKEHTLLHYHYTIYNNVDNADGKYDKDAPLMDVLKFVQ